MVCENDLLWITDSYLYSEFHFYYKNSIVWNSCCTVKELWFLLLNISLETWLILFKIFELQKKMFKQTLFAVAKMWKQLKCSSTDKWIKKMYIYTQWKITQHKNEWNFAICTTWMNLKNIMLNEISQIKKDKYYISLICGI